MRTLGDVHDRSLFDNFIINTLRNLILDFFINLYWLQVLINQMSVFFFKFLSDVFNMIWIERSLLCLDFSIKEFMLQEVLEKLSVEFTRWIVALTGSLMSDQWPKLHNDLSFQILLFVFNLSCIRIYNTTFIASYLCLLDFDRVETFSSFTLLLNNLSKDLLVLVSCLCYDIVFSNVTLGISYIHFFDRLISINHGFFCLW